MGGQAGSLSLPLSIDLARKTVSSISAFTDPPAVRRREIADLRLRSSQTTYPGQEQ